MNLGGLHIGRLPKARADELLAEARAADVTYDHRGSTLPPNTTDSVREHRQDVGHGPGAFASTRAALQDWVPQLGLGARVHPAGQQVDLGRTVLIELRCGPLYALAPNRIVAVTDEPHVYAYAYGTLPGHPERGEESFTLEQLDDGTVTLTIRVDAVPATPAARAAGPLVPRLQSLAARRYLRAVAQAVTQAVT